ncbi:unnamed protein product [Phytomonas sp. EM1]|nr:unnamed protein product [Phytomonas sp. EM1]|eukprot:CCW65348.1 unnamed protein product [Phytomonas sp. isolate EM1]
MDQALKSADTINAVFKRLGVPCTVHVDDRNGKYVTATSDLSEGTALVEELPIVSWPTAAGRANCTSGFCFHCLCQHRAGEGTSIPEDAEAPSACLRWSRCGACGSDFCGSACRKASDRVHTLLCNALDALRSPLPHSLDHVSPSLSSPPDSSPSTRGAEQVEQPITKEALARCVAWVLARVAAIIEQQELVHNVLQADYVAYHDSTPHSLVRQLFVQAVEPFNRLIATPDETKFVGVDMEEWIEAVRCALRERGRSMLLRSAGCSTPHHPSAPPASHASGADGQESGRGWWADALLDGLLSVCTLRTLLGQLTLNAHAINDYVICSDVGSGINSISGQHTEVVQQPAASLSSVSPPPRPIFRWFVKGAAVYALLSCVNHSCDPNAAVYSLGDNTHEIVLKTTRAITRGESICITYIPLHDRVSGKRLSCAERRKMLEGYFFTCQCTRCAAEEA